MMALPADEQETISSDKSCDNQTIVSLLSPQEQEKCLEESHHVDVAAYNESLRNPSPPPATEGKGLDNLSSLLSNLEESWTTVKPHLIKDEKEPMEGDELVTPEPPSLTPLREPEKVDQLEQSMAKTLSKDGAMIAEDASIDPSGTSHWRIGRQPRQASPKEEPPKKTRLTVLLRQLPSRLARILPSSPVIIGEKIVRDSAIQESTVNSFTLNGQEYKLPRTIMPASLEQSTSLTIHDLLNSRNSSGYRHIKEQIYRFFQNKPLRPYKPGSFLRWDRVMQIDLATAQELRQQLCGN
jgi:hypothetical protein